MTDDVKRAVTPNSQPPFEHAHHERTLVLRYFEDDPELTREERLLASALLRTCPWCAALGPEVELIRNATRAMIVPPPGRDFRITPSKARRTRLLDLSATTRRFRAALTTELVRPLAGAAIAVGLVLTVVGAVPYLNSGANGTPGPTAPVAADASLGPESTQGSPEVNAAGSTIGAMVGTQPHADETPTFGVDTSAESAPPPAPSLLRITHPGASPSPSEVPQVAFATLPGPTPGAGANSATGALTQPKSTDEGQEPLPPLLIFGVLVAIVGLLVLGLTVVARRMGTNEHSS